MRSFSSTQGVRGIRAALGLAVLGAAVFLSQTAQAQGWRNFARNPQHAANAPTSQFPQQIRWSTPVDLQPPSGGVLLIHYGTPLITRNNTVIVTVKTGESDGFQVEAHRADTGAKVWMLPTDYSVPGSGWIPSCGCTITFNNSLIVPAVGGTVLRRNNPDRISGSVTRLAFYGIDNYNVDPDAFNASVKICTPITSDGRNNLYFGFVASDSAPLGLQSGIARISSSGVGTWISAAAAAQDDSITKVVYNCAPALSRGGDLLYIAVNSSSFTGGYLLALNSTTLAPVYRVRLKDVVNTDYDALLPNVGTASPTVGPDGDVYFGVLENPFGSNHVRGWMLHFDRTLSKSKTPGAFGWDDTASIVPKSAVPSYAGTSRYLLLTKYNNYVEGGGDGVNKIAVLDPNAPMTDPVTGATVMKEILTIAGPTPDWEYRNQGYTNAVREWCINTAAVDAIGKCALVNNEDGVLYRWDFTTNTLSASVALTAGIGEAYTPTVVGPDGTVYAINDAILFATGRATVPGRVR